MSNRPKPNAIRKLEGNQGHRPLNNDEPKPDLGCPEMPRGLRKAARREWGRITKDLLKLGVLSVIDGKALAMYCDAYADWEEAQKDCVKFGLIIEEPIVSKDGMVVGYKKKPSPAFTVKCLAMKIMKSYLIEFGLTPASRAKLKIERKPESEDLPTREETKLPEDDIDIGSIDTTVQ
jgi:P27 family predicted phage terminase small subunit